MQPAQKMPAGHVFLNVINALPRGLPAGAVAHPQENAGDKLDHQREGQRAAPHVTPARAAGDFFKKRLADVIADAGAVVQPVVELVQAFHVRKWRSFPWCWP